MEQHTKHISDIERRRSFVLSNIVNAATKGYYSNCLEELKIDDVRKFVLFQIDKTLIGNLKELNEVESDINNFVKCRIYE